MPSPFRRSEVIATNRSVALSGDGSNQVFGLDANLAFYENVRVNGYFARSQTTGLPGEADSYLGFFEHDGDRYGAQLERLVVEENFNPEIGFLRRRDFQRNLTSRRPDSARGQLPSQRCASSPGKPAWITLRGLQR